MPVLNGDQELENYASREAYSPSSYWGGSPEKSMSESSGYDVLKGSYETQLY